jgi:dTDP-4-amino-4,6-dideoxygalactose transaminase
MRTAAELVADFLKPEPVPESGIERATQIMRSGKMFRYLAKTPEDSEVSLLERDFARLMGTKYALAVNSASSAIMLSLRAAGAMIGEKILVPGFTFTAVPGAITNIGATAVIVETNSDYRIDIQDLEAKITPMTKILLLSHMRGQIADLDSILEICEKYGLTLIEDAAHGLGAKWRGKPVGSFGKIGCYSFQSAKIVNAGEGGMLTTNDPEIMAKAVIMSGAYEKLHEKHFWSKDLEPHFVKYRKILAPYNMRMNEYTAAIARPQLDEIARKAYIYRENYAYLTERLEKAELVIELPKSSIEEERAPDSIQFRLLGFSEKQLWLFVNAVAKTGLPLAVFGADEHNARVPWNWRYLGSTPEAPKTRGYLATACDMRLPSSLAKEHLDYLADTIIEAIEIAAAQP